MPDKSVWVVVQGALDYYEEVKDYYKDYENVVWSSWKTQDNENRLSDGKHYILSSVPEKTGKQNINLQVKSTLAGLQYAKEHGATHVLKIRSDMYFDDINKLLSILDNNDSVYFPAACTNTDTPYFVDYFQYGPVDKLISMWSISQKDEKKHTMHPEWYLLQNIEEKLPCEKVTYIAPLALKNNIKCYWLKNKLEVFEMFENNRELINYDYQIKPPEKIMLDKEFDKFWAKIENNENFAFIRNGDGERIIMMGMPVVAQEGWQSPNYITKLGKDLFQSLMIQDKNVYVGISCPCCDSAAYYWYSSRIPSKNLTFANLWVNINYPKFKEKFPTLKRDAILIANYRAKGHKIGNLNIIQHYEIDDDCISFWENQAPVMLDRIKKEYGDKNGLLYVVSAGPMSGPIIAELYKNNPNNCYVDFGSAIDIYYREKVSRPYMIKGNVYAERNCWMYNPQTTNFDVSVVLNVYKKPVECLKKQLAAIENQTLKPREILLYQDGTADSNVIPDELKSRCDIVELSNTNKGVWARFDFAKRKAQSEYVCIFDDDTIPGSRWLENCHYEMMKQEGIYGTIGIVAKNMKNYPWRDFYRVGWDGNLNNTVEVDFVGHSWFLKKDWLRDMFTAPKAVQDLKYVGEDMSLSYTLYKNRKIKTFVPPHPKNDKALWGADPDDACKYGENRSALSMNSANLKLMQEAANILLEEGWQALEQRNPLYAKKFIKLYLKKGKYKKYNLITYSVDKVLYKIRQIKGNLCLTR